ncbi:hypothetical protein [Roseiflexus sp.]
MATDHRYAPDPQARWWLIRRRRQEPAQEEIIDRLARQAGGTDNPLRLGEIALCVA